MTAPSIGGRPPRRSEHNWSSPAGSWAYDRWGTVGRPVLLLHGPMFDRTMWWPVAAELVGQCMPIAVDLPGHGASSGRARYEAGDLADELGLLLHEIGIRQAPLVVGHSTSALLAAICGTRFAVHAVVNIGQSMDVRPFASALVCADGWANVGGFLTDVGLDGVPPMYQSLAVPRSDARLLAGYLKWMVGGEPQRAQQRVDAVLRKLRVPYFSIFGTLPWDGYPEWLHERVPTSSCVVYNHRGQFPHLSEVARCAADLRALL